MMDANRTRKEVMPARYIIVCDLKNKTKKKTYGKKSFIYIDTAHNREYRGIN